MVGAALPAQAASGTGWRQVFSHHSALAGSFSFYHSVVATGMGNAWALGGANGSPQGGNDTPDPAIAHWNGSAWKVSGVPSGVNSSITAASAPAANDIWAVTFQNGWILHYDGRVWTVAKHVTGQGEFTGITATSASNVWVFGGGGFEGGLGTWHFNGSTWTQWKTGQAVGLEFASALSAKDIWAVGGTQTPQSAIERFNGTSWQLASTKGMPSGQLQFNHIWASSDRNVWVATGRFLPTTDSDQALLLHFNGSTWSTFTVPGGPTGNGSIAALEAIASDGSGGVWLIEQTSTPTTFALYMVHRTAAGSWLRTKVASGSSGPGLIGLGHIPGTNSLWAVGGATGGNAVIWAYGMV
jgi:hypothetical protein